MRTRNPFPPGADLDHSGAGTWAKSGLPPGQALLTPRPLFKKLIEEEYAGLEVEEGSRKAGDQGAGAQVPAPSVPMGGLADRTDCSALQLGACPRLQMGVQWTMFNLD